MKYAVAALTILFLAACGGTQESLTKTSSPEAFSVISDTPTVFASATHTPIPITKNTKSSNRDTPSFAYPAPEHATGIRHGHSADFATDVRFAKWLGL